MKRILVPVDYSPLSVQAVKMAQNLAEKVQGQVYLVHIVNSPTMLDESGYEVTTSEEKEAKYAMQSFVRAHHLSPADTLVKLGHLTDDINFYIKRQAIDLVLMASQGASGLREVFIGSNAERIVRHATAPVLIVKGGAETLQLESIALAGSFDKEPPRNIEAVSHLQQLFDTRMHMVEVCVPENMWIKEMILRSMEKFAMANDLKNVRYHIMENFSVVEGLEKFMKQNQVSLLALATHQRHGMQRVFRTSIAESVANHLPSSVLTFRLQTKETEEKV